MSCSPVRKLKEKIVYNGTELNVHFLAIHISDSGYYPTLSIQEDGSVYYKGGSNSISNMWVKAEEHV